MKISMSRRAAKHKSELTKIRKAGDIPAVLYSSAHKSEPVVIDGAAFKAALRGIEKGHLPTTEFTLHFEGKDIQVVVKEIQYHPTSYEVLHVDLLLLTKQTAVTVKVPVVCTGTAECVGIKLGGFLRQVVRHIPVKCVPENMPKRFLLDIRNLGIKQTLRTRDLKIGQGIECLFPENEVLVVIAKR